MSEQPPRASSHVPVPGAAMPHGLEPDPEAPRAPRDAVSPGDTYDAYAYEDPEERIRARAGDGLDRVADATRRLGHRAREHGGILGQAEPVAYRVGDGLQSAASYVRDHDLADMRDDVERGVHRSPIKALAIAAVGGFLLGRMFK